MLAKFKVKKDTYERNDESNLTGSGQMCSEGRCKVIPAALCCLEDDVLKADACHCK